MGSNMSSLEFAIGVKNYRVASRWNVIIGSTKWPREEITIKGALKKLILVCKNRRQYCLEKFRMLHPRPQPQFEKHGSYHR